MVIVFKLFWAVLESRGEWSWGASIGRACGRANPEAASVSLNESSHSDDPPTSTVSKSMGPPETSSGTIATDCSARETAIATTIGKEKKRRTGTGGGTGRFGLDGFVGFVGFGSADGQASLDQFLRHVQVTVAQRHRVARTARDDVTGRFLRMQREKQMNH